MVTMIPEQPAKIGDIISDNGKSYEVVAEYTQGKDAKQSGLEYFMHYKKGVLGLKEIV